MKSHHCFSRLFFSTLLLAALTACDKKGGESEYVYTEEDEFEGIATLIGDSVEGEKVSKECAVICYKIDKVAEEASAVNSPSVVIQLKKKYAESLSSATKGVDALDTHEKEIAQQHESEAEAAYREACRKNELPAEGVMSNLRKLIERIDKLNTKAELERFEDIRYGMLQGLDDIHLCVESNSRSIPEVKRLAQVLKSKYIAKKEQLGLE